jgi:cell division septal protein FtsQ
MKKHASLLFFVIMFLLTAFLMAFTQWRSQAQQYTHFNLEYANATPQFHSPEEVENLLKQNWNDFPNAIKDTLDLNRVEMQIEALPAVANAEVFGTPQGIFGVLIEERKPYIRVQGNLAHYVDLSGTAFPLSKTHTIDVPLFIGELSPNEAPKVVAFVQQLLRHDFWKKELTSIEKKNNNFHLQLRSYPFEVEFGSDTKWKQKTDNLIAFCAYYKQNNPQQEVAKINLTYANRVVALAL